MKKIGLFISVFLALMAQLFSIPAADAKRIALVIGNDDYVNVTKLKKAVNDAKSLAATLADLKFKVIHQNNADRTSMNRLLGRIASQIEVGDEVLFYFSGHGVSVNGQNYLLPTDIPAIVPSLEHALSKEAFSEDEIIDLLQKKGARVSILIIDACRNNPFPKEGTRNVGRSVGLERSSAPQGTFVLYSAGLGQEALDRLGDDDANPNSVFTRKLLPLLRQPGLSISNMAKGLRVEVEDLALTAEPPHNNHKQFPAYYDQLRGRFFFVPGQVEVAEKNKPPSFSADEVLWKTIEASKKMSDFEFYLSKFPKGKFASAAENKINQLRASTEEKKVAVAITPDKVVAVVPDKNAVTRSYKPGNTFKDCDECPEMVVVPPGEFMMGSPISEKGRSDDEGPLHKVTISNKFAVGKFEVSFDEWDACVKGGGCNKYTPIDYWGRGKQPVININWEDAKAYVRWLSLKVNNTYRLLSEAEWEYVARANTNTPFWWGKSIYASQANFDGNYTYNNESVGRNRGKTVPVDSFEANGFGLYNVHGNVWEWVEDCWVFGYISAPVDGKARTIGDQCSHRVMRGGAWDYIPGHLRSAYRNRVNSVSRDNTFGFRVARTLD